MSWAVGLDFDGAKSHIVLGKQGGLDFDLSGFKSHLGLGNQRANSRIINLLQFGFDLQRVLTEGKFKIVIIAVGA